MNKIFLKKKWNPNQKHPDCKKSSGKELKKAMLKKMWNQKMGCQEQCSDSTDGNKI